MEGGHAEASPGRLPTEDPVLYNTARKAVPATDPCNPVDNHVSVVVEEPGVTDYVSPSASTVRPMLEAVCFPEEEVVDVVTDSVAPVAADDARFVTTSRGGAPVDMTQGQISASPSVFLEQLAKTVDTLAIVSTPSHRRARRLQAPGTVPPRSSRLAKIARGRAPAVVAAENVLMRKLGIATSVHVETADYDRYQELFNNDFSEEQARHIGDLFSAFSIPLLLVGT
jgi:hypothetical protein